MYGPSVPVHLTSFMEGRGRPGQSGPLDGDGRRSLYLNVRRNFLNPMFLAFDAPVPFSTMGRRNVSNVPAQALTLMNDPLVVRRSHGSGPSARSADPGRSARERLDELYRDRFRPAALPIRKPARAWRSSAGQTQARKPERANGRSADARPGPISAMS